MALIVLVSILAILQFFFFAGMVGRARSRYGVSAPAVSGHEMFERYYRVQMNTLELLVMLLPALWFAALYVRPIWPFILGIVYLVGRTLYWRAYIAAPARRGPGFGLSMLPILILLGIGLVGCLWQLLRGRV
ncbi:MAG TPA: MAPEG family protein [Steroidobacteraceae bacterium]|nr:MAPEG family protein [Steroidobacteraceae bacterium]